MPQTTKKSKLNLETESCRSIRTILPHFRRVVVSMALCLTTACTNYFSPDYERPDTPAKVEWSRHLPTKVSGSQVIREEWWKNFRDPYLDQLIARAIEHNVDLAILAKSIGVAKTTISQVNATRLPTIEGAFGARLTKASGAPLRESYSWVTALSWEIDIWGKIEEGVEAQEAEYKASEADWRAGYLIMVSNLATTYFQIRLFDEQIERQRASLHANNDILKTFEIMREEGVMSDQDVLQQSARINTLEKDLMELQRLRALAENALATIQGIPAGNFSVSPSKFLVDVKPVDIPLGLPSDLLLRRPDIVAAEYRVLESLNLISEARKGLLPTVRIMAKGGMSSIKVTDLSKAFTYGLDPSIELPFLDPNVYARIDVTEAEIKVFEEQYRATVLNAFEEVENALVNLTNQKKQRVELQEKVRKLTKSTELVRMRLSEGLTTKLEVFESERTYLVAELELLRNHQQFLAANIELYKALGGGWPVEEVKDDG